MVGQWRDAQSVGQVHSFNTTRATRGWHLKQSWLRKVAAFIFVLLCLGFR